MAEKNTRKDRSDIDRRQIERRDGQDRRKQNIPIEIERRKKTDDRRTDGDHRKGSDRRQ